MTTLPPPDHDPYRTGNGDRLLAALITIGFGAILTRISLMNNGAMFAPGAAAVLLAGALAIRRVLDGGQARSIATMVAVGLLGLGLLFALLLIVLLVALSNRGE
jgi:hypothetical protein